MFSYHLAFDTPVREVPAIPKINPRSYFDKNLAVANRSRVSCACTQYFEGVYGNPVTLKAGLEVTQGH